MTKSTKEKSLEILKNNTKPMPSKDVHPIIENKYGGYRENISLDDSLSKDKAAQLLKKK